MIPRKSERHTPYRTAVMRNTRTTDMSVLVLPAAKPAGASKPHAKQKVILTRTF